MKWINKKESKFLLLIFISGFFWFFLILPNLIPMFDNSDNPLIPFSIFNLSVYLYFFVFLKSIVLKTKRTLIGTTGLISLFLATDIILPEYHIDFLNGNLIKGGVLGISSSDYFFGWIAHYIGLNQIWVSIFTYGFIAIILFLISSILFKNFVEEIG